VTAQLLVWLDAWSAVDVEQEQDVVDVELQREQAEASLLIDTTTAGPGAPRLGRRLRGSVGRLGVRGLQRWQPWYSSRQAPLPQSRASLLSALGQVGASLGRSSIRSAAAW
jgi:hypothetical protein